MDHCIFLRELLLSRIEDAYAAADAISKDMEALMASYGTWMIRTLKLTNYEGESSNSPITTERQQGDGKNDPCKGFYSFSPMYRYDSDSTSRRKIIYELRWGRISYLDRNCNKRPIYMQTFPAFCLEKYLNPTTERNPMLANSVGIIRKFNVDVETLNYAQRNVFSTINSLRSILALKANEWMWDLKNHESYVSRMEVYPEVTKEKIRALGIDPGRKKRVAKVKPEAQNGDGLDMPIGEGGQEKRKRGRPKKVEKIEGDGS